MFLDAYPLSCSAPGKTSLRANGSQLMLWSLQTNALLRVIRVKRVPFTVLFVTLAVVRGVAVLTGVWAAVTAYGAVHWFVVSL